MRNRFPISLFLIAMLAPEICLAAPADVDCIKEEVITTSTTEFPVRLRSRFLRNGALREIGRNAGNNHKGNSAVVMTFREANEEEKMAGIYYYNYFPDFLPNAKIYSSFFEDKSKRHLYWIVVNHKPPFKFDVFLYIFPYPFRAAGTYPDFISTPMNVWPQASVPATEFRFNSNGYGDFLLDDISFDYDPEKRILIAELREKRGSEVIRVSYEFKQKRWSCTPPQAASAESIQETNKRKRLL